MEEVNKIIAFAHVTGDRNQLLVEHLYNVANLSRSHANKIGLQLHGELIGLLHDLGKFSTEFQNYLKSATGLLNPDEDEDFVDAKGLKGRIDHSSAASQFVWQELSKRGKLGAMVGQILALCLASHHSGLIDCLSSGINSPVEDTFTKRMKKDYKRTHYSEVIKKSDKHILDHVNEIIDNPGFFNEFEKVVRSIILSASDKSDTVIQNQIALLVRFLFSCLIDADRFDSACFEYPARVKYLVGRGPAIWDSLVSRLEGHLSQFKQEYPIDQLRREIAEHCLNVANRDRGTFTLTVPTGGGKTLASLRFALHHARIYKMDRVIYIIPFTSIIDQNAQVARQILEPEGVDPGSIVLEHHSNLTPKQQTWRSKIISENWEAPVVFTTNVQFLETLFGSGTRGARRMHQLANSVLIFDEIQTLPVNCIHLFNNAINFLVEQCGSSVVLCTATQPLLNRVDTHKGAIKLYSGCEIIPDVRQLFDDLKRVEVLNECKPGGWLLEEVAELAQAEILVARSCLVIVNNKKTAQELYRLCAIQNGCQVYHLSTNMCPAHRKSILGEVRNQLDEQKPTICISTQLIEAGVDVDFGSVIRVIAGLDSIAQAAGRCNRHNRRKELGRVHIVNIKKENLSMLPDINIGRDKAERVLDDYEKDPKRFGYNCIGPEAMAWFYENYFFSRAIEMDYKVSSKEVGHEDTLLNLLSVNNLSLEEYKRIHRKAPEIYLRQSFMMAAKIFKAIDAPNQGIVVPFGEEGQSIVNELCSIHPAGIGFNVLRRAQQFSVNVFPKLLNEMILAGVVRETQDGTGILYLADKRYYSSKYGLIEQPEEIMEVWDV
ncbi:MAG: CRISPR-associated helicase Cas3' [Chlorobiaceae bacterium]|nr:CRISPR-associated helicase Cas3' [Chlorobiaceae bacterium]